MEEIFRTPPQPVQKDENTQEPQGKEEGRGTVYTRLASPPQNALKPIVAGNLKGRSDINPQWRIEAMTREFGPCGIGWTYQIVDTQERNLADGQILLFMRVDLRYKLGNQWSEPIPGYGGDFIVEKNKNGLVPNDEAYKMCLTDALGNAMKCIGVAADIYRGLYDTKYNRQTEPPQQAQRPQSSQQNPQQAAQQPQEPWTRIANNRPQIRTKQGWIDLASCSTDQLQKVVLTAAYAPVHQAANNLLTTRAL